MARKTNKQKREEVFLRAMRNYTKVFDAEQQQRQLSKEDVSFVATEDGQWEDNQQRNQPDRPRFTVDKVSPGIEIAHGNFLENIPSIRVLAAGNGATKDMASMRNGLIRGIQAQSNASHAYANAHKEVLMGGRGGWRIKTAFNDDDVFEQDIVIDRICDAASSLWLDPAANEQDKRDAMYGFYIEQMDIDEYKLKFPKTKLASFDDQLEIQKECNLNWTQGNTVSVAQYYEKVPVRKEIAQLTNGKVVEIGEITPVLDELAKQGITIITGADGKPRTRMVDSHKVVMYLMNGMEIIDGAFDFPGKYIPLVECLGMTATLEGRVFSRGLVRKAKDSQRIYNYALSHFIETTAITAQQPYLVTAEQIDGFENEWQTAAVNNPPLLRYKPTEMGLPQRSQPPTVSPALVAQMQASEADITGSLNVFVAPNRVEGDISGKALGKMEKNSATGIAEITFNACSAIQYTGDIINGMIPYVYDSERVIRSVGEDGVTEAMIINSEVFDEESKQTIPVNDLSMGKYDIEVDVGASYASQQEAMYEGLNALAMNNPQVATMYADLMVSALPAPMSIKEEMTRRSRAVLIQQGIIKPNEEEQQEMAAELQAQQQQQAQIAQAQQALYIQQAQGVQLDNVKKGLEAEKLASDIDKSAFANQKTLADIHKQNVDVAISKQDAGLPVTEEEARTQVANTEIWNNEQADSIEDQNNIEAQRAAQVAGTPNQQSQQMGQAVSDIAPQVQQMIAQARAEGASDGQIFQFLKEQGMDDQTAQQFMGAQ
jgi:hypothetical protein